MSKFFVYIPSPMAGMPNLQIKVEADNWMVALQIGRQRVGEKTELGSNIMCDFKEDGSVEITDPSTGRAFSIKEIEEPSTEGAASQPAVQPQPVVQPTVQPAHQSVSQPVVQAQPAARKVSPQAAETPPQQDAPLHAKQQVEKRVEPAPAPVPQPQKIDYAPPPVASTVNLGSGTSPQPKQIEQYQPVERPAKKIEANIEEITEVKEPRKEVGRKDTNLSSNIESIMTSLFTEVYDVYDRASTREDAAYFMLDLAIKKIGAEAGSVLYADLSETELSFIAARGPNSEALKKFKVPIGKGIVGFCVDIGVSLAISDVSKDKRWFDKISKSIGFPTRSIICAPIQYEGQTLGAIELINKKGNTAFTMDDLNILNYIAHETGDAFIRIEGKNQPSKA